MKYIDEYHILCSLFVSLYKEILQPAPKEIIISEMFRKQ